MEKKVGEIVFVASSSSSEMDKVRLDFPGVFLSISLLFETVGLSLSVLGLLPFLPVQKSL